MSGQAESSESKKGAGLSGWISLAAFVAMFLLAGWFYAPDITRWLHPPADEGIRAATEEGDNLVGHNADYTRQKWAKDQSWNADGKYDPDKWAANRLPDDDIMHRAREDREAGIDRVVGSSSSHVYAEVMGTQTGMQGMVDAHEPLYVWTDPTTAIRLKGYPMLDIPEIDSTADGIDVVPGGLKENQYNETVAMQDRLAGMGLSAHRFQWIKYECTGDICNATVQDLVAETHPIILLKNVGRFDEIVSQICPENGGGCSPIMPTGHNAVICPQMGGRARFWYNNTSVLGNATGDMRAFNYANSFRLEIHPAPEYAEACRASTDGVIKLHATPPVILAENVATN